METVMKKGETSWGKIFESLAVLAASVIFLLHQWSHFKEKTTLCFRSFQSPRRNVSAGECTGWPSSLCRVFKAQVNCVWISVFLEPLSPLLLHRRLSNYRSWRTMEAFPMKRVGRKYLSPVTSDSWALTGLSGLLVNSSSLEAASNFEASLKPRMCCRRHD